MSVEKSQVVAPKGPPMNGAMRDAERRAAKELKVQMMLEERALRLASEAKASQKSSLRSSPSEPEPRSEKASGSTREELEKQKLRVACKMEILEFFNGYSKAIGKMTTDQTKVLLSKLHSSDEGKLSSTLQEMDTQREQHQQEWSEKSAKVDDEQSIQRRLRQVNDLCNKVFDEPRGLSSVSCVSHSADVTDDFNEADFEM